VLFLEGGFVRTHMTMMKHMHALLWLCYNNGKGRKWLTRRDAASQDKFFCISLLPTFCRYMVRHSTWHSPDISPWWGCNTFRSHFLQTRRPTRPL